jgi:hypothetical protein
MALTDETIRTYLPYYLTTEAKRGIINELNKFHLGGMQYFLLHGFQQEMLQGDGWTRFQVRNFATGEQLPINGVVLSNTCDVAPDNQRDLPTSITFAPLVPVEAYIGLLTKAGVPKTNIDDKIAAIKRQEVTNMFYVPAGGALAAEHFVLLGDIHSMPATAYQADTSKNKIFTLSQAGFYLFILKLSMHFCRFHENVLRG